MKKLISIIGSTGSVGQSALKIIDKKPKDFQINLLSANKNFNLICQQIKKYDPKIFVISSKFIFEKVKSRFKNKKIKILNNFESLSSIKKSDITISAIPGIAGLIPTIQLIKKSKKILIANKEAVVCGWNIIKKAAKENNTKLIPIDSEHFSIFKLLENQRIQDVEKIFITASGGPFLNHRLSSFKNIKPKDALKHPKWKMGKKISIDSSTLMNKILELVEAQKLFSIPEEKIDILIHPESLVHAIIKFNNGLSKFIYHETSMIIPLANAIYEKNLRIKSIYKNKKNLDKIIKNLTFYKVDKKRFPVYNLKSRIMEYPSTPIIINAANEILIDLFLEKKIPFLSISKTILKIQKDRNYKKYAIRNPKNTKEIIEIDSWARFHTRKKFKNV